MSISNITSNKPKAGLENLNHVFECIFSQLTSFITNKQQNYGYLAVTT